MIVSNFDDDDTDNVDVQDTVSSTYLTNETRRQLKRSVPINTIEQGKNMLIIFFNSS